MGSGNLVTVSYEFYIAIDFYYRNINLIIRHTVCSIDCRSPKSILS